LASVVKGYQAPGDPSITFSLPYVSYASNWHLFKGSGANLKSDFGDGTSNTIFFTEKLSQCSTGQYPDNFWPDWGPIIASSDLGNPVGVASIPQFSPTGSPPK